MTPTFAQEENRTFNSDSLICRDDSLLPKRSVSLIKMDDSGSSGDGRGGTFIGLQNEVINITVSEVD